MYTLNFVCSKYLKKVVKKVQNLNDIRYIAMRQSFNRKLIYSFGYSRKIYNIMTYYDGHAYSERENRAR